jgi:hypothetical protein
LRVCDKDGRSPLDFAIDSGCETVEVYRAAGAKTGQELAQAQESIDTETSKFDEFLTLAIQNNEHSEQCAVLIQLGDLYKHSDAQFSAKLYNCSSFMARRYNLAEEQLQANNKLIDLEAHLFQLYGIEPAKVC